MKTQLKWIAFLMAALTLVGMLLLAGNGPVAAAPLLQMTPAVDPMLTPTVIAPPLDTQSGLPGASTGTAMGSGQASCPMMSGTTGTRSGMSGMSGMPGMGRMSGMGTMPMNGPMVMGDALSSTQASFFNSTNPWWLVGWIIVFVLVIALLAFLVLGILWMARQLRKEKPAAPVGE